MELGKAFTVSESALGLSRVDAFCTMGKVELVLLSPFKLLTSVALITFIGLASES